VTTFARLSSADITRVRDGHPIVDVLGRMGISPPSGWNGSADYMICCPCPDHDDSSPSCIVHPQTDRFHCFGCEAKGDVLELVRRVEGVKSLSKSAEILDSRRNLVPIGTGSGQDSRPVGKGSARGIEAAEKPDLDRSSINRVLAANTEAWRYLTLPKLADRGREYLKGRGIDVIALEKETGRPLVGHTPHEPTGLIDHLRRRGFSDNEIVDAGWGSRRNGELHDRFRRRVMVPVRDENDRVIGVYGRDVTDQANQKYLNTAETVGFRKREAVYRPNPRANLDQQATVIACEGSMDALAIAAIAAAADRSAHFMPVSPSGTALTDEHAHRILSISDKPPLVCADGDDAGIAASANWAQRFMAHGRETLVTVLPAGHDPASWLRQEGVGGLSAFVRKGCLDRPGGEVKPVPSGGLLARQAMTAALNTPGADEFSVLPTVMKALTAQARLVPGVAAAQRFANAAGRSLSDFRVGTDSGLSTTLLRAIQGEGSLSQVRTAVTIEIERGIGGR
jgi:DNA primase